MLGVFIKKELMEILRLKKTLINVCFAAFYLVGINCCALLPGPKGQLFGMNLNLSECIKAVGVCGIFVICELIYQITTEETAYGTLDIMRISPLSGHKLIILKTFIPTIIMGILSILSIVINNITVRYIEQGLCIYKLNDPLYWGIVSFAIVSMSFFSFGRSIDRITTEPDMVAIGFGFLYFFIIYYVHERPVICFLISILLTLGAYLFTYRRITKKRLLIHKKKKNILVSTDSKFNTFLSRELIRLRGNKHALIIMIALLFSEIIAITSDFGKLKFVLLILLSIEMPFFLETNVQIPSMAIEIEEKMDEILMIQGVSRKNNYWYSTILAILLNVLTAMIKIVLYTILSFVGIKVVWWMIPFMLMTGLSVSVISWLLFSKKRIDLEEILVIRKWTIILSIFVSVLWLLVFLICFAKVKLW